ncbi:MAG TPA: alpha/beta fold hydrolase [Gemmatimonadales bacterium]|nr:alpha/beta fold hydrolase [Gemmatimonadales bacterium]
MATPTLTQDALAGSLGRILVDVRAGGREQPRPAAILVHGFKGFKDWGFWPPFAERLARAGVTTVSFNMSGSGVDQAGEFTLPEQFARNTCSAELADLATVVNALMSGGLGVAPPSALALIGHSRGGAMAILHAARDSRVRALVTWAAVADLDRAATAILDDAERQAGALDVLAAAARITVPWLIVHGREDESVTFSHAERLLAAHPGPGASLLALEHAGHTFGTAHPWRELSPMTGQVFDASLRFLATALHPAGRHA